MLDFLSNKVGVINSLIGFGGGTHKCWGMKFAYNEMAVVIALLLRAYEMEVVSSPVPEVMMSGMLRPATEIRYRRRDR